MMIIIIIKRQLQHVTLNVKRRGGEGQELKRISTEQHGHIEKEKMQGREKWRETVRCGTKKRSRGEVKP